jgi:hypothetical protein
MSLVMARNWPVVRRENEYTAIQAALVDQPGTCGIVIIGDARAGKTTLARRSSAVASMMPTCWISCRPPCYIN